MGRRTYRTSDRSDKVLVPRSRSVIFEFENVLLSECRSSEKLFGNANPIQLVSFFLSIGRRKSERAYSERSRSVTGSGP